MGQEELDLGFSFRKCLDFQVKIASFQLSIGKAAIPWGNTGVHLLPLTPSLTAAGVFCSG